MSKLKKFIEENRGHFDDDMPSPSAWREIERSVANQPTARQRPLRTIYRWMAAASALLIIGLTAYFLSIKKDDPEKPLLEHPAPVLKEKGNTDIGPMAPEFAAEANKIFQSIESQQEQLKTMAGEQPELYSQFAEDLAALDSSYRVLKTKAVQTPNREVIIRAMLQNLQLQAELLGKQLSVLNEIKHNKPQKNEERNRPRT